MSELAQFKMSMSIDGMKVPGLPEGEGDRGIDFHVMFDATDLEKADEIFYSHLRSCVGEDEQEQFKALAARIRERRR